LSFTRELRLLRAKENETSIDMVKKLGVKLTFLSAIENGKTPIKKDFLNALFENYDLNNLEKETFKKYAAEQNKKLGIVYVDLKEISKKVVEELEDIFFSDDERVQLRHKIKEFEGVIQEIEGKILFSKACHLKEKEDEYQKSRESIKKLLEEMKEKYKKLS
jgi:transcriptional regulator with XRE-family HTH domain